MSETLAVNAIHYHHPTKERVPETEWQRILDTLRLPRSLLDPSGQYLFEVVNKGVAYQITAGDTIGADERVKLSDGMMIDGYAGIDSDARTQLFRGLAYSSH